MSFSKFSSFNLYPFWQIIQSGDEHALFGIRNPQRTDDVTETKRGHLQTVMHYL